MAFTNELLVRKLENSFNLSELIFLFLFLQCWRKQENTRKSYPIDKKSLPVIIIKQMTE